MAHGDVQPSYYYRRQPMRAVPAPAAELVSNVVGHRTTAASSTPRGRDRTSTMSRRTAPTAPRNQITPPALMPSGFPVNSYVRNVAAAAAAAAVVRHESPDPYHLPTSARATSVRRSHAARVPRPVASPGGAMARSVSPNPATATHSRYQVVMQPMKASVVAPVGMAPSGRRPESSPVYQVHSQAPRRVSASEQRGACESLAEARVPDHRHALMRRLNESASFLSDVSALSEDDNEEAHPHRHDVAQVIDGRGFYLAAMLNESATWIDCDTSESDREEPPLPVHCPAESVPRPPGFARSFSF